MGTAIRPKCYGCGQPINDPSYITWNGRSYHNDHIPTKEPPRLLGRSDAIMISGIIMDEMGGEKCTGQWARATADRIVSALNSSAAQERS